MLHRWPLTPPPPVINQNRRLGCARFSPVFGFAVTWYELAPNLVLSMTKTGFLQQKPTEGFVRILPPRKPRVAIGCGAEATRLGCLDLCDDSRPRPAVQPEKNAQLRNYIYSNGGIALKPRKTIIRHSRTLWFAFCRSQKQASQLS